VLIAIHVADDRSLELVQRVVEVSERRPELVTLVTYRVDFNMSEFVKARQRLRDIGVELETHRLLQLLYTKIYANEEGSLFTSTNLSKAPLFRDVEFALLVPEKQQR